MFSLTKSKVRTIISHVVLVEQKVRTFNFFRTLKIAFLPIFLATLISTNLDQFLNTQIESLLRSPLGLDNAVWFYATISVASSLVFPLLVILMTSYFLSINIQKTDLKDYQSTEPSLGGYLKSRFELGLLEVIRSWGKTFLWCFVFIVPGLIKYCYYSLAPVVVCFSKKYHLGEVDALEMSEKIFKKHWLKFSIYVLIFTVVIPFCLSSLFDEYTIFKDHYVTATAIVGLNVLFVLIFYSLVIGECLDYLKEEEHGINV